MDPLCSTPSCTKTKGEAKESFDNFSFLFGSIDEGLSLSLVHWTHVAEMLSRHIEPDSQLLHLSPSILPHLSPFYKHTVISSAGKDCHLIHSPHKGDAIPVGAIHCTSNIAELRDNNSTFALSVLKLLDMAKADFHYWNSSTFLLTIGPCSSAPIDILPTTGNKDSNLYGGFTAIEDVCQEGTDDIGVVLYRYLNNLMYLLILR